MFKYLIQLIFYLFLFLYQLPAQVLNSKNCNYVYKNPESTKDFTEYYTSTLNSGINFIKEIEAGKVFYYLKLHLWIPEDSVVNPQGIHVSFSNGEFISLPNVKNAVLGSDDGEVMYQAIQQITSEQLIQLKSKTINYYSIAGYKKIVDPSQAAVVKDLLNCLIAKK